MKRLHIHVSVDDLAQSIRFYSTLFAAQPAVTKPDYAKWMLDDPRVNFAISIRSNKAGIDHLGIQVETPEELKEVYSRLQRAERPVLEEGKTTCCYANSEKAWTTDPQGFCGSLFSPSAKARSMATTPRRRKYGRRAIAPTRKPLPAAAPSHRPLRALLAVERENRHDGSRLQRPLSLHRQQCPVYHGGSHPAQIRRWAL
jgi:catechol 2,3-dioxygenase-like lactoylglutathione lyase family enzyme